MNIPSNPFDQEKAFYEEKARILSALAHPTRLWMVEKLAEREYCVCEFTEMVGVDFSTISKHLSILKQAGVVEDDKRGKKVFYRLKVPCVLQFMSCVEAVIRAHLEDQLAILSIGKIE